jgi:hypothetical protein
MRAVDKGPVSEEVGSADGENAHVHLEHATRSLTRVRFCLVLRLSLVA